MIKETLTKEKIKIDLKRRLLLELVDGLVSILAYWGIYMLCAVVFLMFVHDPGVRSMVRIVLSALFGALFVNHILLTIVQMIKTKKGAFQIAEDWVVDKLPKRRGNRYRSFRPYTLIFARCGKYGILPRVNYKWSTLFPLEYYGVYRSSDIDDDFMS